MADTALEVELGRFAAGLDWDTVPAPVQGRVLDIWVDTIANALVGRRASACATVEHVAERLCGDGGITIIGGGATASTAAALVNGFQITAFTMCDVYRPALCHVTPEVLPAVVALAEQGGVDGMTMLAAITVGLEITTRLGLGVDYPRFRANGWHSPGVIGTVGASAATARVLDLDDKRMRQTIGLGASQAAGTFAAIGTPAVKFHQARGAVSALWAAAFAAERFGGSERALTHTDGGLFATYASGGRPDRVLYGLGEHWELEQISLRRWPAASSLQALVDCVLNLETHGLGGVERVEVALPRTSYDLCADMGWSDELSAMQSARFVAAAVLRDGQCWIDQFAADCRTDPGLDEFARTRVEIRCDPDLPPAGAAVQIDRRGSTQTRRCDIAPGDPARPLTRTDVLDKLAAAARGTPPALGTEQFAETLLGTADLPNVSELCVGMRTSSPSTDEGIDRELERRG